MIPYRTQVDMFGQAKQRRSCWWVTFELTFRRVKCSQLHTEIKAETFRVERATYPKVGDRKQLGLFRKKLLKKKKTSVVGSKHRREGSMKGVGIIGHILLEA